ncbi:hypothetical protein [Elioraea tepidiphila]|uniref:hypothetical protein n=1 Tax=Elioraea tepidiphila TaxID=457934 RepID=UPI0004BA2F4C|nr:hypothetical protein [Elioraea tepidiphila]
MNGYPRFYAWGFGGQMIHIVPRLGLSVVMTSDPTQRSGGAMGHAAICIGWSTAC